MLLRDPTGGALKMPLNALVNSPFHNYVIPGLILFIFIGVIPLVLVYALIAKPLWRWADYLNIYKSQHWAWTYSLYIGIILVIWIDVQILFLGYGAFIQSFYALLGVVMIIVALIPSNVRYYSYRETDQYQEIL